MRRFLSIAICSVLVCAGAVAYDGREGAGRTLSWSNNQFNTYIATFGIYFPSFGVYRDGFRVSTYAPSWSTTAMRTNAITTTNLGTWVFIMENSSWNGGQDYEAYRFTRGPGGTVSNIGGYWGTPPDPVVTNSFSWTFGPEWAGTILQVRATNGTTLGTWGLPSVIGSNYVLSASIVTNQSVLTGAQVFLDGSMAAALATAGTNSNLNTFADRPGYELSFGADYQGGEWQVRRSDGSVAATGSAATLGTVSSGRVTLLPEGSSGSIWTRVPAGDGMGSVWINSGITVSGNSVTSHSFAAMPQPTPLPTPSFQTNAPAPTTTNAPVPTNPGTNTTAPAPVATNDVTVDVEQLESIPSDDGEEAVLEGVRNASEKLRGILEDFRGSFDNVALTFNEFRKFTLGGVGTTCTFTLGDVTINLSNIVPAWLRSGMKLAILILAVFAMIRYTWDTFS